ncbi:MAG: 1-deoxy-D-xylulose-5-phosphate reductoisomerase [Lachnospiraceae bacterium]
MSDIKKRIAVLGSTGSIGTQTLEVVRNNNDFIIDVLAADSSVEALEKQVREFSPRLVCVYKEEAAVRLKEAIADTDTSVVTGMEGLIEAARFDTADIAVTAMVGMIGIRPTIEAIKAGKDIALANKETLVTAGHIIMPLAKEHGVKILPVDSEHSAIFQCLNGEHGEEIDKILLTASGGPFRGKTREQMRDITVEQALKHPNWAMGRKITIDSATMVNKGLEVMEARWLFNTDFDNIQVVVQPQSLIHSMIQFKDGAIVAQLGTPDMKLPIQYALTYPERRYLKGDRVDFNTLAQITFFAPDMENFAALRMAYEAGRMGGVMPTVFNAANEMAVSRFLDKKIGFLDITDSIQYAMSMVKNTDNPDLKEILDTEQYVYELLLSYFG